MKKIKIENISFYILNAYLFLMLCIYPLYVDDGYYNIGFTKIKYFHTISLLTFFALLITMAIQLIQKKRVAKISYKWCSISITEKLLYIYMAIILLSFLMSPLKEYLLLGLEGWGLGTAPLLLMSILSIFLIHEWKEQKWMGYACLIVSGFVFFLGICHRFSFYPIRLEPTADVIFISTLGNINWFCGYMSVISPIGIGMYILNEYNKQKDKWKEYLLISYIFISFIVGFCQGSNSYFLWTAVLFILLFCISLKNITRLKKYALTVGLFGIAGQTARVINYLFPGRYNYEISVLKSTIDTDLTLIIALIGLLFYFLIKPKKEIPETLQKLIISVLVGIISLGILLYIILSVYNTKIGIPNLNNSLFLWNDQWGNGRGLIFKESVSLFGHMNLLQKLIGVGADGFYYFAYSIPEVSSYLNSTFGDYILTNAHCEILTSFIQFGILGTIVFIGIFITFITRCIKHGEQHPLLYIAALCTTCYFSNNLISFSHVLNIPFLFIIIGLSEHYMRKNKLG